MWGVRLAERHSRPQEEQAAYHSGPERGSGSFAASERMISRRGREGRERSARLFLCPRLLSRSRAPVIRECCKLRSTKCDRVSREGGRSPPNLWPNLSTEGVRRRRASVHEATLPLPPAYGSPRAATGRYSDDSGFAAAARLRGNAAAAPLGRCASGLVVAEGRERSIGLASTISRHAHVRSPGGFGDWPVIVKMRGLIR